MISNSQGQLLLSFSQQFRKNSAWNLALGITLLGVFLSASAQAAVFTVNSPSDAVDVGPGNGICETALGNCTLRAAIQESNALAGADEIILPPNTYLLTIVSELGITSSLTITGGGASTTIIDGNKSVRPNSRVLVAGSGIIVNISGVTIRNGGTGGRGGGIFNVGMLTLTNSTVSGNNADQDGGGIYNADGGTAMLTGITVSGNNASVDGGGISNDVGGTVTLTNSTVSGNNAGDDAGGIFNLGTMTLTNITVSGNNCGDGGGGIRHSVGTLTLTNSTVSGNNAGQNGGGFYNFSGTASSFNSTITDNRSDADLNGTGIGGGVHNDPAATFTFQNTILAGNFETQRVGNSFVATTGECDGTITSSGNNLMKNYDTSHCTVTGNPLLADPKLGPLQNNGGPTQTHALLVGSPAIDGGNPSGCRDNLGALLATDQRGFRRTVVATCDIGAYELIRIEGEFGEVLSGAPGQASVLAGSFESSGASRGPAFQLFDSAGTLQTTQFVLNPDFRIDVSFVVGNFDADTAGEILVGGQETSGLARGPAYQLFDSNGAFIFTRFVLNPDFSDVSFSSLNVGSNGVLACGQEIDGLARGPAYQAFDANGNLVRTQFVLNADFTMDDSCMGTNLDGVAGDEVITAGREVTGLGRGPAFQVFGSDGSFRLTRVVLNPDFTETKLTTVDVGGSKNIVVSGRETSGLARGPAYQTFNSIGNFILTRFVLNRDFTAFQLFGANTTNGVSGQEIVTGGLETGGLARGPAIQVWDKNGNHLFTRLVLNPDFTEVTFSKIDINNDGLDEILVVGRETKGLRRGPAFQLFDGNGNLLVTQFVLNADFTNLKAFTVDQNGDGDKEIGIGGIETSGLMRGPAYQIFESNGTLLQTRIVLNPDF
jgi:hypothetical protein